MVRNTLDYCLDKLAYIYWRYKDPTERTLHINKLKDELEEMKEMNEVYVTHTCRNSKLKPDDPNYCNRAWVDVDKTHVKDVPPTWKYCPECEKKGFKNPKTRKSTKTPEQIEAFKQRMKAYREQKKKEV